MESSLEGLPNMHGGFLDDSGSRGSYRRLLLTYEEVLDDI